MVFYRRTHVQPSLRDLCNWHFDPGVETLVITHKYSGRASDYLMVERALWNVVALLCQASLRDASGFGAAIRGLKPTATGTAPLRGATAMVNFRGFREFYNRREEDLMLRSKRCG